ncbi:DNA-processing protein DprA [Kineosporia sp. NBRC 101731]|uniref:DNA-processing protein DprA n=1 Tax=Kineosporia sp. NBRC 101731 TaxID=3032199 RepID=UPI002555FFA8|nr:DNA-processing protein DprA [Kineosporia sp. NBRC 101731]
MAWSRLAEPGDIRAGAWVARRGAVAALAEVRAGRGEKRYAKRLVALDPARDLHNLQRLGGRLLIPSDPEWPDGLNRLETGMPFCLYVRGPMRLDEACVVSVSIVGARAATSYGEHVATDLGTGCADRGVTVVSGAALGIDAAAHRGALAVGGPTLAVLAGGLDRAYPPTNELLIGEIGRFGALVSEVPPGQVPTKWRFIFRNRIIAALGRATCVVEAGNRSGTMGTANWADRLSIPVGAVPGPITSPSSYGAHRLLRNGAVCVTSADELCELVGPIGAFMAEDEIVPAAEYDGLEPRDLHVLDALPVRKGVLVSVLCTRAGAQERSVTASLARLELRGLAEREGDGWRRAPARLRRETRGSGR